LAKLADVSGKKLQCK